MWGAAPLPTYGAGGFGGRPQRPVGSSLGKPGLGATPASGSGAATWTPPPTGSYNPERTIQVEEGERGLGQLEGQNATQTSRLTSDYAINQGQLNTRLAHENQDYGTAQGLLKQQFARLATSQQEGANKAGVLSGGALLQAAAKRAANEAQQSQQQATGHERNVEGIDQQLAALALQGAPPDASNPEGGRAFQDLTTSLTNARANQSFFAAHQHTLAGQEAAENGYTPPEAPATHQQAAAQSHARAIRSGQPHHAVQNPFARYRALGRRF